MIIQTYTVIRENWLTRKMDPAALVMTTIATLVLVLASSIQWANLGGAAEWMPASNQAVFIEGHWWRAWSALFAHSDFGHLLGNCFLFFIVGIFLSGYFGSFVFPVGAMFAGGITNLIVLSQMKPTTGLLGASGVVFWMGGFWLVMYFLLERRRTLTQRALRALGVALVLFMPAEAFDPSISYVSHLTGFINGLVCGVLYFWWRRDQLRAAEKVDTIIETDDDDHSDGSLSRSGGIEGFGSA